MTVTVQLRDGPTARLDYDGPPLRRPICRSTNIMVSDQIAARLADGYLHDLLQDAAMLLMLYIVDWEEWPAELRPANPAEFRARIRRQALGQDPSAGD
jgi:hypothetical protein